MNNELENFIEDWFWDKNSYQFAQEIGLFLFQFLDNLKGKGISAQTIRKHSSNCWLIGKFECDYGYHESFTPAIFEYEYADHLDEFKRKVSDSKYAIESYKATRKKISQYVKSLKNKDEIGDEKKET